ncbi:MAG TPA: CheR family methyltransferase [Candidatus Dormibacteraeota bacterium]
MIETPLDRATVMLRTRAGLKPEPAARARLERLLHDGAGKAGLAVSSYVDMVETQPAAFEDLLDRVTVQHGGFFRDPAQFKALAELVSASNNAGHTVWSAGCGNGQEPFSIAMVLEETGRRSWQVIATDVSFRALARVKAAVYFEGEIQGLSPERRARHLLAGNTGHLVADPIRRKVRLAHQNLNHAGVGGSIPQCDVVFCRNVLMYFGPADTAACIRRIAHRMVPGGHLFLGHSDSPGPIARYFAPTQVAGVACYRRLAAAARPPAAQPCVQVQAADVIIKPVDLPGLLAAGDRAAALGDLRAAIRAFRQATYLDPNLAVAYFQLGAALELSGDAREARRAYGAAGLAMMRGDGGEDLSGLGGYTRVDLARAIATKLTAGGAV